MLDASKIRVGLNIPASTDVQFKLAKVGARLLANEPFYATLWLQMRPTLDWSMPTAWVTDTGIYWNPDFLEHLDMEEALFVAMHEILHKVLFHIDRARRFFGGDPTQEQMQLWNYAGDAIINDLLEREYKGSRPALAIKMPTGPDPKTGKIGPRGVLLEVGRTSNKTIEQLYMELLEEAQKNPSRAQDISDFEQDMFPGQGATGDGDPGDVDGDGDGDSADGKGQSPGESGAAKAASAAAKEAQMRSAVAGAFDAAKKQGKVPAGLERLIDAVLTPTKSYRDLLRMALTPLLAGRDDYSWRRPHRGYKQAGIYAPSIAVKLGMRHVVIGIDTSGSQSKKEIDECIAECRQVMEDVGVQITTVAYCDAKIHRVDTVEMGEAYEPSSAPGGGGTSFAPVFQLAEELGAEALIYMTDMYCDFPPEPEYPVVWVTTTNIVGPYGQSIALRE